MKRMLVSSATALSLLVGAAAVAQTSTTTTTTTQTTVTTDQQAKIKAYVAKEKRKSTAVPAGVTVATGATLPSSVELYDLPSDVGVKYRYTVVGNRTVLVDPGTHKIIQVIE